jgi:lipopolysaccharide export system permease protein
MIAGTLSRYIMMRFVRALAAVFLGMFLLIVLLDYIELTRRVSSIATVPPWMVAATSLYRVPQITERLLPFSILVAAMICYLNLSRRNELVIARAAGVSAWQFVIPTVLAAWVIGLAAATIYNPLAATLSERSKQFEEQIFGRDAGRAGGTRFWIRQRGEDAQSVLHASSSRDQGASLAGVTVFVFDLRDRFVERMEADTAKLEAGYWRLDNVRIYNPAVPPRDLPHHRLPTNLNAEQVRESLATPETVSFWQLPTYIDLAERAGLAAAGYRIQYQNLLARPFLLAAMVLLAASVSLRFFRFGGVQRMVLYGVGSGFLLYVMAKVTEDLSKADLMYPTTGAWLPVIVGALTGIMTLLFQEDG